ncbi:PREDICTED: uncharacterized protein LOC101304545 [Fragaria vesca subsp. vesca]
MRLTPDKCLFGVVKGKFLGRVISRRGIEANPEKVQAILDMEVPTVKSDVQSLTGKMAALASGELSPDQERRHHRAPSVLCRQKGFTLAESRYPDLKKLALALIVLQKPEVSGRLAKGAIELGEFNIHYMPRVAIKGQAAIDFISELTPMKDDEVHPEIEHEYSLEFMFSTSNNAAEYEALIGGLQLAQEIGVKSVQVFSDSQLVVNQVSGTFEAKEPHLNFYQAPAKALLHRFESATVTQIPRKENSNADVLARLATGTR